MESCEPWYIFQPTSTTSTPTESAMINVSHLKTKSPAFDGGAMCNATGVRAIKLLLSAIDSLGADKGEERCEGSSPPRIAVIFRSLC